MIRIATDGSCIQQGDFRAGDETPRPGAYGMIADLGEGRFVRRAMPAANGLIGGMEVSGLLLALEFVRDLDVAERGRPVLIQCDSQYVVNGYNDWMHSWQAKGWRKKGGAIANLELWKRIWDVRAELADRLPKVEWVKAHQNVGGLNDQVDAMVNTCARTQKPLTQYEAPHGSLGETPLPLIPTQAQYEEASAALDRTLAVFTKRPPSPMEALYDARFPRAASPAIPTDPIDLGPPWDVTAAEGDVPTTGRGGTELLPAGVQRHETADGTEILATPGVWGTSTSLHRPRRDTTEAVLRDLIAAAGDDAPQAFRELAERARAILA